MIEAFLVGVLFMLFVLVIFCLIFAAAVCFVDVGTKSASKPKFEPYITDDEQNLFVHTLSQKYGRLKLFSDAVTLVSKKILIL